ncbi:MAG: hypothetical protein H6696_09345 [Deferribacteres bacterium]|nr:hypothetical protein [candidate division KSB1 bacterium]MCB9502131.1 hypothetical protein [Deferribacteres bacterium]
MTGLKEIRFIGNLIQSLTDGLEKSLTAEEIYKKAKDRGLPVRVEQVKFVLEYLIANEEQIQAIDNRYFHQKQPKPVLLYNSKYSRE